jgi:hypothetical protein
LPLASYGKSKYSVNNKPEQPTSSPVQFSSVQFSIGISFREEEEEEEEEATTSCTAIQYKAKQSKAKLTLH